MSESKSKDVRHGTVITWFDGDVAAAIAQAKKDQRPIFLYWGAVWCPPCNEVKAEIFSQSEFADMLKDILPVYLDGDSDGAQEYGERFEVSGYPTMLLLGPDLTEWLRFSEALSWAEFRRAFTSTLAAKVPVLSALDRAASGQAVDGDWERLAYASQYVPATSEWLSAVRLSQLFEAIRRAPADSPAVRALLTSKFLTLLATAGKDEKNVDLKTVVMRARADRNRLLGYILDQNESARAAHEFLFYEAKTATELLFGQAEKNARDQALNLWEKAIKRLRKGGGLDPSKELRSYYGELSLIRVRDGAKAQVPKQLRFDVQGAVKHVDRTARTPFQRQALIPGAAFILQEVGEAALARELLEREVQRSVAPWYIYSSLASLEERLGNFKAAKNWSHKAADAAQGNATKLQWLVNDILLTARHKMGPDDEDHISNQLSEFYRDVFRSEDGFWGRNRYRLEALANNAELFASDSTKKLVRTQRSSCDGLEGERQKRCSAHFDAMQAKLN